MHLARPMQLQTRKQALRKGTQGNDQWQSMRLRWSALELLRNKNRIRDIEVNRHFSYALLTLHMFFHARCTNMHAVSICTLYQFARRSVDLTWVLDPFRSPNG